MTATSRNQCLLCVMFAYQRVHLLLAILYSQSNLRFIMLLDNIQCIQWPTLITNTTAVVWRSR